MAVKIRMKRLGAKKRPFYRIVVADSRSPRNGRFIEEIGYYNPIVEPKVFKVDEEKVQSWIQNGAKPTETVAKLFKKYKVAEGDAKVEERLVEATKHFAKQDEVKAEEETEEAKEETEEVAE